MEAQKNKQIVTTIVVLVSVAIVVGAIILFNKKTPQNTLSTTDSSTTSTNISPAQNTSSSTTPLSSTSDNPATSSTTPTTSSGSYKDGSYSTSAEYYTPEETDSIKVTLAVKNGVVTNVSASTSTSSRESRQYDSAFLNAYKSYVVGKSLGSLNLNRVSGASLTTEGFNKALDAIRQQAHA